MTIPLYSLYIAPSLVKALEKLVENFEDVYRKELQKDIKAVVGEEDWQVMPLSIIDENKPECMDFYYFDLGFKYGGDAYGIVEIFPFNKEARFNYDRANERKIEDILKNKGYKVEYRKLYSMPKLNDQWNHKK
jgi:hypothetical protein